MCKKADIGVVGLGVMGENLALNMERNGFRVACYNRSPEKTISFLEGRGKGLNLLGCSSLDHFAASLGAPRKILIMVKAGKAVDETLEAMLPFLARGDVVIDGGNSHYKDTIRRCASMREKGIFFVGAGISGGEEGALHGPSIMPGGDREGWPIIKHLLRSIAAKADDGSPCCEWVGPDGAGHFVKMVHNGIEYGDMQLLSETYHIMRDVLGMSAPEMAEVFSEWNEGSLQSYLVEITSDILRRSDEETGRPMADVILDAVGQKGTGRWTTEASLELGAAVPQLTEAVFARVLSVDAEGRKAASELLCGAVSDSRKHGKELLPSLESALYAAKICSYAQGFRLMQAASDEYGWNLDLGEIALLWREGCIIRARFLNEITDAFHWNGTLRNLLLAPLFRERLCTAQAHWRKTVTTAIDAGIPVPALSSALAYYDAFRCARLGANLVAAQRDYFGAHTYERTDRPRGTFFHAEWSAEDTILKSSAVPIAPR